MDKVNLQTFRLDNNFKNSDSSEEDILASLFSIPIIENINDDLESNEFVFPSKNFDFLDKENLIKIVKSLNIDFRKDLGKDLNVQVEMGFEEITKKSNLLKKLKSKIIPDSNNNLPQENKYELNINLELYSKLKKPVFEKNKILKNVGKIENHIHKQELHNVLDNSSKSKTIKLDTSTIIDKSVYKVKDLNVDSNYSEEIENEENLSHEKIISSLNQKSSFHNHNAETIKLEKKSQNENQSFNTSNQIKVDNSNLKNQFSNEQGYNNDKNMNFLLDNFIEELNMSEKGWTEKLVVRVEKALSEGNEEIELFLKPKELGNLKVSLLLNKNNAKILFKAENNFVVNALQQNESLLTKLFNEQGIQIETTDFESHNFNNQNEFNFNTKEFKKKGNSNPSNNELGKEQEKEKEKIEIENSNYIINVKA